jgi:hypothetical protein
MFFIFNQWKYFLASFALNCLDTVFNIMFFLKNSNEEQHEFVKGFVQKGYASSWETFDGKYIVYID